MCADGLKMTYGLVEGVWRKRARYWESGKTLSIVKHCYRCQVAEPRHAALTLNERSDCCKLKCGLRDKVGTFIMVVNICQASCLQLVAGLDLHWAGIYPMCLFKLVPKPSSTLLWGLWGCAALMYFTSVYFHKCGSRRVSVSLPTKKQWLNAVSVSSTRYIGYSPWYLIFKQISYIKIFYF